MLKVSVALAAAQGLLSIGARETAGAPTARGRALPQPGGWDPGLRSRLAASAFPDSPNYFESCPDSPDRRCHGSLAPGSGFYTLGGGSTNSSCKINGGAAARWSPNEGNPNVPCPFKFAWREDPSGGVIASAEVDSRSFLSGMTPNLYVGLQENIVVPPVYGGLSVQNSTMCPPLADVAAIAFKMRATLCFGVLKPGGFGRVSFYFTYWNLAKKVGRGISVDIFTFLYQPRTPSMPIRRPGKPFMDDGNALHLDGAAFGLVPNLTEPLVDRTPDCSLPIEHAPWVEVRVDVPSLLSKLLKMGVVEEEILAGAVLTGAIGANKRLLILLLKYQDRHRIAIRGRHRTVAEVSDRTVMMKHDDTAATATSPPNIILVIADDLGWNNVGWHGNAEVQTPSLDNLLKEGIEIDRMYAYKYCSPTRSSILSGRLPHLVNEQNREVWQAGGGVDLRMEILPAKLKKAGYISHQLGKWHAGMSSVAHMPTSRGFASSFGYLGAPKIIGRKGKGQGLTSGKGKKPLSDAPAKTKNGTLFGDEHFAAAAVDIITAHDFGEAELFVYLALQVVHEPVEAPERYLAQYPDSDFATRRTQNAMASVMDSAVKNVTDALHARGVFDKTLIFFTADNGGNSGYSKFAGNNYPHRGGKSSDFEGGVRVSAFVSGGALPASLRGAKRTGLMHVADLHATLCGLAGAPLGGQEHGVPAISSLDMWGYLSGSVEQSPRTEVPLSTVNWHGLHFNFSLNESAAVIVGRHKLVVGSQAYLGFWQGALYPNQSTPCGTEHVHGTSAVCGAGCGTGCVFDIFADPSEHVDLAPQLPQLKADLLARLQRMRQERFQTDGDNSRLNFSSIGWTKPIATRAKDSEARGDFWGPYSISDMAV